jgi:P-type E1-E2 ATPase
LGQSDVTTLPNEEGDLLRVFTRIAPDQQLQLVKNLQRSGLMVAIVGDGVNDMPPLRAANIGVVLARGYIPCPLF